MSTVLVIAPHPDDEVLGVGGAILRHIADGDAMHVVICTRGEDSRFGKDVVEQVWQEVRKVHARLGLVGAHALDFPAALLDTIPSVDFNAALSGVFAKVRPDIVYVPHPGDVHLDHQLVFQAALVCSRPVGKHYPRRILAYETVSETDWYAAPITPAFVPNVFIDITEHLEAKLEACALYASQIRPAPDQRSLEAIRALSVTRGTAVGIAHAEAFVLIREISC